MVTAGEVIKSKRESLGKDLNTVCLDTKIQRRFLEYIENNQFEKFDSKVFASGFIKIYSKYLGLDVEKILALYRRSTQVEVKSVNKKGIKGKKKGIKLSISPRVISISFLILFLILIVGYVGFQIFKFQTPPTLTIFQPNDGLITNEQEITVKGITQSLITVQIDGKQIETNEKGEFESVVKLTEGVNTISVKAMRASNNNLNTTDSFKVIYNPIKQEQEVDIKKFLLSLSITQSPSWIKLDIDDENKISQVLQPNTIHEFEVNQKFTLVTGRVQNTKLIVNEQELILNENNTTGIAQITCNIVLEQLECQ